MENKSKTLSEVLTLIKEKGYQLDFDCDVPDEYKGNMEVIKCIMENGNLDLKNLPDTVKNDKQLLMLIAKGKSYMFENFPDWAKDDKEIVLTAISESYDAFEHASERLRGEREVVIAAFTAQSSYDTIKYVASEELENDIEVLKLAVKGHKQAFGYIPEKWRTNKELIELVLEGEVSSSSFEHFPIEYRDNEEIAKKVVGDDAGCFEYLSERLRDNREIALLAVKERGIYLEYASPRLRDDKEFVIIALNHDTWSALRSVSERLKNEIEIVLACVSTDNRTLGEFADEFRDHERVIEACMKERKSGYSDTMFIQGKAYKYFSDRFKTNREIALHMSLGSNFNLGAAPENFRNDKQIVNNAVKEDADNYQYIGKELLSDLDYLRELHVINDGILYHMDEEIKTKLFTTTIESVEHYGRKIINEMVIDGGYVQNEERPVKSISVRQGESEIVCCDNFPVLSFEEDGPVGSYLTWRYLNNIVLLGSFAFFVKENSGSTTTSQWLAVWNEKKTGYTNFYEWRSIQDNVSNNDSSQISDELLSHEVYLIPESAKNIDYNNLSDFPRIYFGRPKNLPVGIQLFYTQDSYKEALTVLKQEHVYGEPKYKKLNAYTLEAVPGNTDEVFCAARVYVDGFGWRFLIPNKDGASKSLEVLKATTDRDDLNWIKMQSGNLTEYQINLLKEHFGDLYK